MAVYYGSSTGEGGGQVAYRQLWMWSSMEKWRILSRSHCLALSQYLENASFLFSTLQIISLPQRSKCGCCGLIYYTKSSSLQRKRHVDFPATYQEVGRVARWARPAGSVPLLGLAIHWRLQTLRKQERPEQLGAGTDILFGRRSLSSHTRLSFYLFMSCPCPFCSRCGIDTLIKFGSSAKIAALLLLTQPCAGTVMRRMRTVQRWRVRPLCSCPAAVPLVRVQIVNCGTFKLRRKGNFSFVFLKPVNKDKVIKTLGGNNGSMGNDL